MERVDYETARALKLLGFPQDKNNRPRLGEPHYVTIYKSNWIHKYVEEFTIGHLHCYDVMCYAPTKAEACEWLLNQIKKGE
jgi:hypothetical protein